MHRWPKKLLDLYLFGNFHIAFGAVSLAFSTQLLFHFELRWELFVFLFCGTFFGYNIQRLPSAYEKNIARRFYRHHWNTEHRVLLTGLSAVALIAFSWSFFTLYHRTQIAAIVPAILSFAYAFPVIPTGKKFIRLREIPGAKIFVIGITWAISCVIVPATAARSIEFPWHCEPVIIWTICVFLLIIAITIPFDIRDMIYDAKKLKALPHLLNINGAKILAVLSLAATIVLFYLYILNASTVNIHELVGYVAWCVIAAILVMGSTPKRHEYYFSFLIDGTLLIIFPLLLLASYI